MNRGSKSLLIGVILFAVLILVLIGIWRMYYYENEVQILRQPEGEIEEVINLEKFKDLQNKASEGKKYWVNWVKSVSPDEIVFHYDNREWLASITAFWLICGSVAIIFYIKLCLK